jgi:predicted small secreted protein
MRINLAKTCLAVLLGVAIGVVFTVLIRPRPVKAQGETVFVDPVLASASAQKVNIRGSRVVGFACMTGQCYIASQ